MYGIYNRIYICGICNRIEHCIYYTYDRLKHCTYINTMAKYNYINTSTEIKLQKYNHENTITKIHLNECNYMNKIT